MDNQNKCNKTCDVCSCEKDKVKAVAKQIMKAHETTLKTLAQGPKGEYHHSLETKLKEQIELNKKLTEEKKILETELRLWQRK